MWMSVLLLGLQFLLLVENAGQLRITSLDVSQAVLGVGFAPSLQRQATSPLYHSAQYSAHLFKQ